MNIPFHFVGRLMQHHCQKDGWCLQKGIFLQNEGYGKSISAHYQLFLSLQGYTLSLVKLVQWWKFGTYKMLLLFGALRFRLCPTILYPSKFLVPIHFVGFFQCPPFCVYKRGVWPHGANFNGDTKHEMVRRSFPRSVVLQHRKWIEATSET